MKKEIEEFIPKDVVLSKCWQLYKYGDITYQEMLEMMVIEQTKSKQHILKHLIEEIRDRGPIQ